MYRFYYEKKKLETQHEETNMKLVQAEEFDPYPGQFMKDDLENKIFKSNIMLALDYLSDNEIENAKATLKNIYISKYSAEPEYDVFKNYLELQDEWENILNFANNNFSTLYNLFKETIVIGKSEPLEVKKDIKDYKNIIELPIFKLISEKELDLLLNISEFKNYKIENLI
jgi:hypothetical protein